MAKGAATEKAIAALHAQIAEVLDAQLSETICLNPEAVEDDGVEPELMFTASPALLTLAARFVKDNDVGMDIGETGSENKVRRRLDQLKQNRGKVVKLSDIHPIGDAADG